MSIIKNKKFLIAGLDNIEQELGGKNGLYQTPEDPKAKNGDKKEESKAKNQGALFASAKKIPDKEANPPAAAATTATAAPAGATGATGGKKERTKIVVENKDTPKEGIEALLDEGKKHVRGIVRGDKGAIIEDQRIKDKEADAEKDKAKAELEKAKAQLRDAESKFGETGKTGVDAEIEKARAEVKKAEASLAEVQTKYTSSGQTATDVQQQDVVAKVTTEEIRARASSLTAIVQSSGQAFLKQIEPVLTAQTDLVKALEDKEKDRSWALAKNSIYSYLEMLKIAPTMFADQDLTDLKNQLGGSTEKAQFVLSQIDYSKIQIEPRLVFDRKGISEGFGSDKETDPVELYFIDPEVKRDKLSGLGVSDEKIKGITHVHNADNEAKKAHKRTVNGRDIYFYVNDKGQPIEIDRQNVYAKYSMEASTNTEVGTGNFYTQAQAGAGPLVASVNPAIGIANSRRQLNAAGGKEDKVALKSMFCQIDEADETLHRGMPPSQQSFADTLFAGETDMNQRRLKAGFFEGFMQSFPKLAGLIKLAMAFFPNLTNKLQGRMKHGPSEAQAPLPNGLVTLEQQRDAGLTEGARQLKEGLKDNIISAEEKEKYAVAFKSEADIYSALNELEKVGHIDKAKVGDIAKLIAANIGITTDGQTLAAGSPVKPGDLPNEPGESQSKSPALPN